MDYRNLHAFTVLAETLHYRKASEKCYITTSALTRIIQRIEDEVGTILFNRTNRSVHLTIEGQIFYDYAKKVIHDLQEVKHQLHCKNPEMISGTISIFATVTATCHVLPPFITSFYKKYPNVKLMIETGNLAEFQEKQNNSKEIDLEIGITNNLNKNDDVVYHNILTSSLSVITPQADTSDSLEEREFIFPARGKFVHLLMNHFERLAITPKMHSHVNGHEAILALVASGLASSVLPTIVMNHSMFKDEVRTIPLSNPFPDIHVGLISHKKSHDHHIKQLFFNHVLDECSQRPLCTTP